MKVKSTHWAWIKNSQNCYVHHCEMIFCIFFSFNSIHSVSLAHSKTSATPLLLHWSDCSPALSHQYVIFFYISKVYHYQTTTNPKQHTKLVPMSFELLYTYNKSSDWPITMTSSSASRLFTKPFIQAQIKENIKAPHHWPLYGEFTGDR